MIVHDFGVVLRLERERQSMSMITLAGRAGLPVETLGAIESGEYDPLLSDVVRLADALHVTVGGIVGAALNE